MARGTSRTLASRARSVVGRALGSSAKAEEAADGTATTSATAATRKATGKQAAGRKTATAKATPAKKTAATKTAAKKTPAKKAAATKSAAKKTAAKKTPAKKTPATTTRKSTPSSTEKTTATKKASAAPTTTATTTAPKARKGTPGALVVLPTEQPWTKDELDKVKAHLADDVHRLAPELDVADHELHDLMVDSGDGAGADQADVGSSSFERDQGLTIANNTREMLEASQHALDRIADGSYGVCESCGEPIGKKRLMAFPRATLCMTCKQREERH